MAHAARSSIGRKMTYCIGLKIAEGLVFLSDTRTNAGIDNIASYRKTPIWCGKGDRDPRGGQSVDHPECHHAPQSGNSPRRDRRDGMHHERADDLPCGAVGRRCDATGPRSRWRGPGGARLRLFQIYAAGNFIEATLHTSYFQAGEPKYGKPILDSVVTINTR